jgi:hypothetical protein
MPGGEVAHGARNGQCVCRGRAGDRLARGVARGSASCRGPRAKGRRICKDSLQLAVSPQLYAVQIGGVGELA